MRALLDAGAERVQKELVGEPELQAEMLTMMGRTYRRLAQYDKAQRLLEQALASGRESLRRGARHRRPDAGHISASCSQTRATTPRRARTLERALQMRRKLLGPEHPDVAITLAELGRVYQDQGLNHARRAAAPGGAGNQAQGARRRAQGNGRQPERSRLGPAAEWRSRGRRNASPRNALETNRKTRGAEHPTPRRPCTIWR